MGEEWRGGDVKNYPGGGHKINILKKETELHKNESNLVLMFVDRYDVSMTVFSHSFVGELFLQVNKSCFAFFVFLFKGIFTYNLF